MSDYNLGTAHGRIVVDYDDKGPKVAGKDMDGLGEKAKNLVRNMLLLGKQWRASSNGIVEDTAKIARGIAYLAGGIAILGSLTSSIGQVGNHLTGLRGGIGILGALGTTMGGVHRNVQGFPSIIKKIILLSAAITLLKASTGIIRTVFSRFLLLRGLGGIIGGLGDSLFRLARPIRAIAGLALFVGSFLAATKMAMKLAKGIFMANGALAVLAVLLYIVGGAADAIGQLSGLLGLLPGILLAAGLAAATLKIGLMGVGDALKSGDISKLSKEAGAFVTAVRSMKGQWEDLKKTVQDKLFAGLGPQVKELGGIYLPVLKNGLAGIAMQFNLAAKDAIAFFKTAGAQSDMKSALDGTTLLVGNLRRALAPLLQVFMDVAVVGISVLGDLSSGAGSAAERFAAFVREARETGKLKAWIEGGVQGFRDLWNILGNVYHSLKAVFTGLSGGEGEGALAWLRRMTDSMRAFLEATKTQEGLRLFGTYINTVLARTMETLGLLFEKLGPILVKLAPFVLALGDAFSTGLGVAISFLAPIFSWLVDVLNFFGPVLIPVLAALFTLKIMFLGLGVVAAVFGGILSTLSLVFSIVKGAITAVRIAMWLLNIAFAANPIGVVIAIIVLLVAAIIWLWNNCETFRNIVIAAWEGIQQAAIWCWENGIKPAVDWIVAAWQWLMDAASAAADGIMAAIDWIVGAWQTLQNAATAVVDWIVGAWNNMIQFFVDLPAAIGDFLAKLPGMIAFAIGFLIGLWVKMWITIIQGAIAFGVMIVTFFMELPAKIGAALSALGAWLATTATDAWNSFTNACVTAFNAVIAWFTALPQRIVDAVSTLNTMIVTWITGAWSSFTTANDTLWAGVGAWFAALPGRIITAVNTLNTMFVQWITDCWNGFIAANVTMWTAVGAWFATVPGMIGEFFAGAPGWLAGVGLDLWNGLIAGLGAAWGAVTSFIGGLVEQFLAGFRSALGISSPSSVFLQFGIDIIMGLLNGLRNMGSAIIGWITGLGFSIASIFSNAWNAIKGVASAAWNAIKSTVSTGISNVISFVASLPGKALSALGNLVSMFAGAGRNIISGILNGLSSAAGRVISFLGDLARRALNSVLSFFGIASPSKVFMWVSEMNMEGMIKGMRKMREKVRKEALAVSAAVTDGGTRGIIGSSKKALTGTGVRTTQAVATTWNPYERPKGGDGAAMPTDSGTTFTGPMSVTIPAADIAEMKSVTEFFDKVQQTARAGKAT